MRFQRKVSRSIRAASKQIRFNVIVHHVAAMMLTVLLLIVAAWALAADLACASAGMAVRPLITAFPRAVAGAAGVGDVTVAIALRAKGIDVVCVHNQSKLNLRLSGPLDGGGVGSGGVRCCGRSKARTSASMSILP